MMPASQMSTRGVLVIVSSPSGAGKTTLTKRLLEEFKGQLEFSVSYTTRPMRAGEVDGRDYHFVGIDKFEEMARNHEFAEHAFVFDNRYGTAAAPIEDALAHGRDVIFDVDWQGGKVLSARWPDDCLKVFILPPDLCALERRLRQRATDTADVIERRNRKAHDELEHYGEYQHLIVNDDIERSYALLRGIYLTRKYGEVSLADVPYDLPAEAERVKQDRDAAWAHAKSLVGK